LSALCAILTGVTGCIGAPRGTVQEQHAYFQKLEDTTLARLKKEQPATEQELAAAVGYAVIEQNIVKIPVFGAGSGAGVVVEKEGSKRTYLHVPELQFGAGWGAREQKIVLIFFDLDTLRDLANGIWRAGLSAEASAKAGEVGGGGGANTTKTAKKEFSTYVLTENGVSATVTLNVIRAQPYSID
jgi:hypothetical protein